MDRSGRWPHLKRQPASKGLFAASPELSPVPVPPPASSRRAVLAPLAVLASSLLLTGAVTTFFLLTARERDSSRFEGLVRLTHDRIAAHLDSDITLLRGAAGLFAASTHVTADEFSIYVERL